MKTREMKIKAEKYDKLVEYITSLGCQADIDMLKIIGASDEAKYNYEKAKKAVDDTWNKNTPLYGHDLQLWPVIEKDFVTIIQRDINNFEMIYGK